MSVDELSIVERQPETRSTFKIREASRTVIAAAQMAVDGVTLVILSYVSLSFAIFFGRHDSNYIEYLIYLIPTIGATLFMVFIFARSGVYDVLNNVGCVRVLRSKLRSTLKHLMEVIFILIACLFILKRSDDFSRIWLTMWTGMSAVVLCAFRLVAVGAAQRLIRDGRLTKNVAVVGANDIGHELATSLSKGGLGTRVVGLFDERRSRLVDGSGSAATVVAHLSALDKLLPSGCVDEVVIAIPPSPSGRILELMRRFHPFPVSLRVLSPAGYENFEVLDSRRYGEIGTFCVMGKPLDEAAVVLKRIADIVIVVLSVLFSLPLLLLIALCIKIDSPGPVFFKQKRLGANNLPFNLLKFRSMYVEQADPLGRRLTEADDPRVTRVGRFLRRASLDELPQLLNVLRGEMSLVGPRPHPLAASAGGISYARAVRDYPIRHRVKPGITGWAQVNGWRGETATVEQIQRRVEHDLYYIENWSLTFDFLILGRTVFTVLSRQNAV
jgi:Undecaprenyl-phosphate glucose phosphotransferase